MMTVQLDATPELAAIPYGLVIALAISVLGILTQVSREEIQVTKRSLVAAYHRTRDALRLRHIRVVPGLPTTSAVR